MKENLNYLLYDEMVQLISEIEQDFPEIINVQSIGKTYDGRDMQMVTLTMNSNATSSMLITGAHHSRELASIQLPILSLLKFLHRIVHSSENPQDRIKQLLNDHKVHIIPVVNVDGFYIISQTYKESGKLIYKRKNNNQEYQQDGQCSNELSGVDINRNYEFEFGRGEGSSDYPCAEDFRGPHGFSEPESRAMRDLITTMKDELKLVYNIHTYGNLFVHPFNSDNDNRIHREYPEYDEIYDELWRQAGFPTGNKQLNQNHFIHYYRKGNGVETVGYSVDGEASDWIFNNFKIIAASPELGTQRFESYDFFVSDRSIALDILNQNLPWVEYSLLKLDSMMGFNINSTDYQQQDIENKIEFTVDLLNKGFDEWKNKTGDTFDFSFESPILSNIKIESDQIIQNDMSLDNSEDIYHFSANQKNFNSRNRISFKILASLSQPINSYKDDQIFLTFKFQRNPNEQENYEENIKFWEIKKKNPNIIVIEDDTEQSMKDKKIIIITSVIGCLFFIGLLAWLGIMYQRKKRIQRRKELFGKNLAVNNDDEDESISLRKSLLSC